LYTTWDGNSSGIGCSENEHDGILIKELAISGKRIVQFYHFGIPYGLVLDIRKNNASGSNDIH
jgi:hypothetical protein